jgi:hypothetical protein
MLNCGSTKYSEDIVTFSVNRFKDIYYKIIPLFKKYEVHGIKSLDFKDFCQAAELILNKSHLTLEGLEKIKILKSKMNSKRKIYI